MCNLKVVLEKAGAPCCFCKQKWYESLPPALGHQGRAGLKCNDGFATRRYVLAAYPGRKPSADRAPIYRYAACGVVPYWRGGCGFAREALPLVQVRGTTVRPAMRSRRTVKMLSVDFCARE